MTINIVHCILCISCISTFLLANKVPPRFQTKVTPFNILDLIVYLLLMQVVLTLVLGSADHQAGGETVSKSEGFRLVATPYP